MLVITTIFDGQVQGDWMVSSVEISQIPAEDELRSLAALPTDAINLPRTKRQNTEVGDA